VEEEEEEDAPGPVLEEVAVLVVVTPVVTTELSSVCLNVSQRDSKILLVVGALVDNIAFASDGGAEDDEDSSFSSNGKAVTVTV
jgi:hypothetical protein